MLSAIASVLLVPPVNLAVLALAGVALSWRRQGGRRPGGRRLAAAALLLLLVLALPVVSNSLLTGLERGLAAPQTGQAATPQAIVILGGDVARIGTGAGALDIAGLTLARLRGGAALARRTKLPVLVTGGVIDDGPAVATLMQQSLEDDFAVPARWVEAASLTTWDNAQFSAAMLKRDGIGTVYLVTDAWHMRRALIAFAAAGLVALPAPPVFDRPPGGQLSEFVPRVSSWQRSYFALHEWIGCAWYAWRARG